MSGEMQVRTSKARVVCTSGSAIARTHVIRNSTRTVYNRTGNRIFICPQVDLGECLGRMSSAIAVWGLAHQVPRIFTGPSLRQPASDKRWQTLVFV
jgi:hypothetical protein